MAYAPAGERGLKCFCWVVEPTPPAKDEWKGYDKGAPGRCPTLLCQYVGWEWNQL